MATKTTTPEEVLKKAEEAKKAPAVKKAPAKKAEAPKAAVKKAEVKVEAPKAEAVKAPAKKAEAPKAAAKKTTTAKKAPVAKKAAAVNTDSTVYIEFMGGQINVADLVEKAKASIGDKTVKELKVYYQPETGMVYYTADGESGSYSL